jgi:predicted nucleotidyltransferase
MQTSVTDKATLLKKLTEHRNQIKSFGVFGLSLFGSFADDLNILEDSEVDLLVDFEPHKKTYDNFMELSFYLEELTGRKIELVTRKSLNKYIAPYIIKQAENVSL